MAKNYARARELQTEKFVDELVTLADSATPETAQAVRLSVDTRKWIAGRMLPKKYGDKVGAVHVTTNVQNVLVTEERLRQLQERRQAALQR